MESAHRAPTARKPPHLPPPGQSAPKKRPGRPRIHPSRDLSAAAPLPAFRLNDPKSRLARELRVLKALTRSDEIRYIRAKGFVMPAPVLASCVCGGQAVIARDIYEPSGDKLLVRCPACDRRVRYSGSFPFVRKQWNAQVYSAASERMNHPRGDIDTEGLIALCEAVFRHGKYAPDR